MAWDKTLPTAGTSLKNSNPQILENFNQLETQLDDDHAFPTNGQHTVVHLDVQSTPGAGDPAADHGALYSKDAQAGAGATQAELHYKDEAGNEIQLTSNGRNANNNAYITSSNAAGNGGVNLIKADGSNVIQVGDTGGATTTNVAGPLTAGSTLAVTGNVAVNTNKFTVAAASGNTLVAGTLDVTGTLGVTGIATLGDASTLATSAAPTADAEIANKKYVDDVAAGTGFFHYDGTQVHSGTLTTSWQNLDLSAKVGAARALVFLKVNANANVGYAVGTGEAGAITFHTSYAGPNNANITNANDAAYFWMMTDTNGYVQHGASNGTATFTIILLGYIR